MRVGVDEALARISERTADNYQYMKENLRQRRNVPDDLYGVEYYRQGDGGAPATFYLSISPDMVYLERLQFKLIIEPFMSSVAEGGVQSVQVAVNNTSLSTDGDSISPNPHKHTTVAHTHTLTSGLAITPVTASDFVVKVEGIDITPYLMAQYNGWISGQGVYPSGELGEDYDLLEVASDLVSEGEKAKADKILRPGYKKVQIFSNAPFSVIMVLYRKSSHLNR